MISEKILRMSLGILNQGYLRTEPWRGTFPAPNPDRNYTLYLHIPFCERLCTYCSFHRFQYSEQLANPYYSTLRKEMELLADLGYDFKSLYIGGGTPTVLLSELAKTIDHARNLFPGIGDVSVETSPSHLNRTLEENLGGRVQRLSVGIQSFDDTLLMQMDRFGKYGRGEDMLLKIQEIAGGGNFPAFNVDMIFNHPGQTENSILRDVLLVKETGASQVTFYPLMASPAKRLEMAKTLGAPDRNREEIWFGKISSGLRPEYSPISAWTYAQKNGEMIDEYIVDEPEYIGIGSGALSFINGTMYGTTFSLKEYSDMVNSNSISIVKKGKPYSRRALMRYKFATSLFGLHLDKEAFRREFGVSAEQGLWLELAVLRAAGGVASDNSTELTLNERGRYLLMVIMRETLALSNDARDRARADLPEDERNLAG